MDKLTPEEIVLQAEGSALLSKIVPKRNVSQLVGADGKPIGGTPLPEPDPMQQMRARQDAEELRHLRLFKGLTKLIKEDKNVSEVYMVAYTAYKLLFWCRMELATHADITDEMIHTLDKHIQKSIYDSASVYKLDEVYNELRYGTLKTVKAYIDKYTEEGKQRKLRIDRLQKEIGKEGIPLPTTEMKKAFGAGFAPGRAMVLCGEGKATTAAAYRVLAGLREKAKANVYTLHATDNPDYFPKDCSVIPLAKWKNAAANISTLTSLLDPVVDNEAVLLIVESLKQLYVDDELPLEPVERKAMALKRLYGWAVENLVGLIVCDDETDAKDNPYGFIPAFSAEFVNDKLKIGQEILP